MELYRVRNGADVMNEVLTTITKKGQVTIPVEIRHSMGLGPGDKVAFVVESGDIKVKPVKSALERSFGAVKPRKKPEDFNEIERLAEEAMAEDAMRALK